MTPTHPGWLLIALLVPLACQPSSAPSPEPKPAPLQEPQVWTLDDVGLKGTPPQKTAEYIPEANPRADASLPTLAPTEQGVRAWIHERHKLIANTVLLDNMVLDFDKADEILVRVPFKPSAEVSWQWVFVLDVRGDAHTVIKEWATPGVDAQPRVLSSGTGHRALLMVESQGKDISMVEVVRLDKGGELTVVARLGGQKAVYGTLEVSEGTRPIITLRKGSDVRAWKVQDTDEGMAVRSIPAPSK